VPSSYSSLEWCRPPPRLRPCHPPLRDDPDTRCSVCNWQTPVLVPLDPDGSLSIRFDFPASSCSEVAEFPLILGTDRPFEELRLAQVCLFTSRSCLSLVTFASEVSCPSDSLSPADAHTRDTLRCPVPPAALCAEETSFHRLSLLHSCACGTFRSSAFDPRCYTISSV
jgi:hypothetical protein